MKNWKIHNFLHKNRTALRKVSIDSVFYGEKVCLNQDLRKILFYSCNTPWTYIFINISGIKPGRKNRLTGFERPYIYIHFVFYDRTFKRVLQGCFWLWSSLACMCTAISKPCRVKLLKVALLGLQIYIKMVHNQFLISAPGGVIHQNSVSAYYCAAKSWRAMNCFWGNFYSYY